MYDYYLGGKDNFEVDRAAAEAALMVVPNARRLAWENRAFLGRAVRYMIEELGITQFLDVGCGLPTAGHVHEVTGKFRPDARVVYVDNDDVVLAHSRALLRPERETTVVKGDMRDPVSIFADEGVQGRLDFSEPVGLLLVAMLHFATDDDRPFELMKKFTAPLASGSAVAISHITSDGPPARALAKAEALYERTSAPLTSRSRDEITGLFGGLEMASPGVVYAQQWRPEKPRRWMSRKSRWLLAGVGTVPKRSA